MLFNRLESNKINQHTQKKKGKKINKEGKKLTLSPCHSCGDLTHTWQVVALTGHSCPLGSMAKGLC